MHPTRLESHLTNRLFPPLKRRNPQVYLMIFLGVGLLSVFALSRPQPRLTTQVQTVMAEVTGNSEVYLPLIHHHGPFSPTTDTTISGGTHTYTGFSIPQGITVTITGDVVIQVVGETEIGGNLISACHQVEIRGTGAFTLDGYVSNPCPTPPAEPPGIKIIADGLIMIGSTFTAEEAIVSEGEVFIADTATENESTDLIFDIEEGVWRAFPGEEAGPKAVTGAGATINRPIRAKAGKELRVTNAGPVNVNANLTAEHGKDADSLVIAGTCDASNLLGGTGGRVSVYGDAAVNIGNNVTITAGNGGKGGTCTAPSGCPATATAGKGGLGGSIGFGGGDIVFGLNVTLVRGNGGLGGDATATADDGPGACENGCDATATGGVGGDRGGIGYLIVLPGSVNGNPTEAGGNGGTGGVAMATGGDGQDCDQCPGGKGGDGGMATSLGGQGGDGATGNIWAMAPGSHLKGNGGNAIAAGGHGGNGANCCGPDKFGPHMAGGDGGKGGEASATGGQIGLKGKGGGGIRGATGGQGGNGGNGGDGAPPGAPGAKGLGTGDPVDIPDGVDGVAGEPCPVLKIWFIYHSLIPDGAVPPGSTLPLPTFVTTTVEITPTGQVPLYFMTQADLGYPPLYTKADNLLQVVGGLQYDLLPILEGFPVIGADVSLDHTCPNAGCIQVVGFSGGEIVGQAQNQLMWGGGAPIHEQILLPPPPPGLLYDRFAIVLTTPTAYYVFDHWWIIIIDP